MDSVLLRCNVCEAEAWCVGADETHSYYECAGARVRHEWSELRNPTCDRCGDPLVEHLPLLGATAQLAVPAIDSAYHVRVAGGYLMSPTLCSRLCSKTGVRNSRNGKNYAAFSAPLGLNLGCWRDALDIRCT